MIRRLLPFCISLACFLSAWPTVAADGEPGAQVVTGLTNTGIGMFIIAGAAALLTTLLFRAAATQVARRVTEKVGKYRICKILRAKSANVLEDFIIPGAYGGLTRIDYAILTSGGILCIQTKHYNGVVFGAPDEPQWTNVDGIHRRKFLNPMIQNEGRTRALQNTVPDVPVANLVVEHAVLVATKLDIAAMTPRVTYRRLLNRGRPVACGWRPRGAWSVCSDASLATP